MGADAKRYEIRLGEAGYPGGVARLKNPPAKLYVLGDPACLAGPCLSIIGARRATPYGIAVAEMAARVAAQSGLAVVSGGAVGCDSAAGRAALDEGGRHVVVLGCGADVVYPKRNAAMFERVLAGGGALVSLAPWGTAPQKWAFPERNRVIAALSEALVVTEAGMPSGTFSTAEAAMELGREILSIPGSILSPESRGSNYLIGLGATCIADEDELEMAISRIYGVLRFSRLDPAGAPVADEREKLVLEALVANPLRMEEVAALLECSALDAMQLVSRMSVTGTVEKLPDGRFAASKLALHSRSRLGHNGKT